MPLPVTRTPFLTIGKLYVETAYYEFDNLLDPAKFGSLSNAVVDGLSQPEILAVVQASIDRIPEVIAVLPNPAP